MHILLLCVGFFFFLGEGGFISDMCFLRNKVKRSLWKTFSLSFSQLELCWRSWQDRRGWKFYFHVDFGREIHRGLSGVCADTGHVLCTLEKKKLLKCLEIFIWKRFLKSSRGTPPHTHPFFGWSCLPSSRALSARGAGRLCRAETGGNWREKCEPLVSINKHNSQAWAHRPPSREHLLWFVGGV